MHSPRIEAPAASRPEDAFAPLAVIQNAIHFWWFVSLLVVIGGLGGWLFHRTHPPVYEAKAQIPIGIDYVATGPLTQYEEDTSLDGVNYLLNSPAVAQQVVDQLKKEGIQMDLSQLRQISVMERNVDLLVLRIRASDPQVALHIASIWTELGRAALLESYRHAVQADHINRYMLSLENCLSQTASSESTSGLCSQSSFAEIQSALRDAGKSLAEERLASHGLFAGLAIGPADQAQVSSKPVIYDRNQVVFAGSLIGFLLGVWLLQLGIPARWVKSG